MAERQRFTLISPNPRLAGVLHERQPRLVPEDLYHWAVDYVEEVGAVMRSREYKVSILASGATYALFIGASRAFPLLTKLGVVSEAFGLR